MTALLAFDTSTELLALALAAGERRFTAVEPGGARASAALLPALRRLLAQAGLAFGDLDAIAFGQGPGAFTGLRTSCAVAQGLGYGLGLPLVPLDSLLVVAEDARVQCGGGAGFEVAVAVDARMDEVYAGRYRVRPDGGWQPLQAPALCTLAALAEAWQAPPPVVAGSALAAFGERLAVPPAARRVDTEADRAGALLRLALAAFAAGAVVDPADALPLYLRDKVAQTTAEREAARAAAAGGAP